MFRSVRGGDVRGKTCEQESSSSKSNSEKHCHMRQYAPSAVVCPRHPPRSMINQPLTAGGWQGVGRMRERSAGKYRIAHATKMSCGKESAEEEDKGIEDDVEKQDQEH